MQKKELAEAKAKADFNLDALQKEIALQHARDFHKAIAQVQCLNPNTVVEGVGISRKLLKGNSWMNLKMMKSRVGQLVD
ncbi:catalase [Sesbania bispinosa]|nr:catalase [Sesbania bispinosa]